jgi:competence protein ComEC
MPAWPVRWFVPILGYVVGSVPLLGMFANTLVVPLVSLVTFPAAMLNVVVDSLSLETLEVLTRHIVGVTMPMTKMLLNGFSPSKFGYFDWLQTLLLFATLLVLSVPMPVRVRLVALSCLLITVIKIPKRIAPGEFLIRNLDVGQGSAAIIETRKHRLVVDVGPSFAGGFDAGESVVVPSVGFYGPNSLHAVVVSHRDNDHVGGLSALTKRFPKAAQINDPAVCINGLSWKWDGVRFTLLRVEQRYGRNNGTCTVLIEGRQSTAYLAGDIELAAEHKLFQYLPANVDFLLAPHHGSRTSSNERFVSKLLPRWVVVSSGKDNRYGHPHADVVARYKQVGSEVYSTAELGQITYRSWRPQIEGVRCGFGRVCLPLTTRGSVEGF